MDYKNTILLPKTDFPMRAELPKREPAVAEAWQTSGLYEKLLEARKGCKTFILHDGPPFANGNAHMGHALNMTLKDLVLKSKNMAGYNSPFLPGWDCHGLPIEHKVTQELEKSGKKRDDLNPAEIRRKCEAYARKYIEIQKKEFQRLGVFGDWENSYLTMNPGYEAEILRGLAVLIEKDWVYQGMRPVLWSTGCQTALAEAEVEYQDRTDTAVYVRFPLLEDSAKKLKLKDASLLIWTTTPWTLPANLAVAVHPAMKYVAVECGGRTLICAESRVKALEETFGKTLKVVQTLKGADLEGLGYRHPLLEREGKVYEAHFVTEDSGTGLVHIAPGHGYDDYQLGMANGLNLLSPVDENGKLTAECGIPEVTGKYVFDANADIVKLLQKADFLMAREDFQHSYPHCWRSKTPIIFRCVKQWFIKVEDIRQDALKAIDEVKWVPGWGVNRIRGAVESRPDWCISRQRTWGVPIPVFYDSKGEPVLKAGVVRKFADIVEKEGTNVWFEDESMAGRLGVDETFSKGTDTLDVWIDSGSSHLAVLKKRAELRFPAELYLEGSDQHRGWFQSSLLISIAVNGAPPYREVLTNGFVVDLDGKKLSKSNANQKPAGLMDMVSKYGADILRLWVASQDYRDDVPFSEEIFRHVTDTYRLFRNTFRVLLGNLNGFDPSKDAVESKDWPELERYIIRRLNETVQTARKAYENYEFHQVYHTLNRFCSVDLSALYIDVLKDRLYCDPENAPRRRASQTVMREIVSALCRLLAPITPFTAEEVWKHLGQQDSVHLQLFPEPRTVDVPQGFDERWTQLLEVRSLANEKLEKLRQDKVIGKSLEAEVAIQTPHFKPEDAPVLEELLIVSQVEVKAGKETVVEAQKAEGQKCARCWKVLPSVAKDTGICPRCAEAVGGR